MTAPARPDARGGHTLTSGRCTRWHEPCTHAATATGQSPQAPPDAQSTPGHTTLSGAPDNSADTDATTTGYAKPSHPSWLPDGPPVGGAAYPSPPPSRGTSDTTTKTGRSPEAQSTHTHATGQPRGARATDSHLTDQRRCSASSGHASIMHRSDLQLCAADLVPTRANVQVRDLCQPLYSTL